MQLQQFAKSYRSTAVQTATPGHLVLMLFDGALRHIASAGNGFSIAELAKRNERINNSLIKAQDIVRELQVSLDHKVDPEFSGRMHALYDFMIRQLNEANMTKSPEPIALVERLLGEIRDAWSQMLKTTVCTAA